MKNWETMSTRELVAALTSYARDVESEGREYAPACMREAAKRLEAASEALVRTSWVALPADARALWAVRVLWAATANDWHISQPYPHKRLGGWELIATPPNARDKMLHGDTAELCCINAAAELLPGLPAHVRAELGECP